MTHIVVAACVYDVAISGILYGYFTRLFQSVTSAWTLVSKTLVCVTWLVCGDLGQLLPAWRGPWLSVPYPGHILP